MQRKSQRRYKEEHFKFLDHTLLVSLQDDIQAGAGTPVCQNKHMPQNQWEFLSRCVNAWLRAAAASTCSKNFCSC